ncbi:MAG TPA: radical SAM protein [Spirochaetota bacterium]|nr:radical SAM protein [Spirochaetota bacterium]
MSKTNVTIPFFIPHLGCRHRCVFCNQVYTSNTNTPPNEDDIINKVELYLKNIKSSVQHVEIAFFGGSFTGLDSEIQKKYLAIAHAYYSKKMIHGIRLSTRPDYINKPILQLLKEYTVTTIELGVQSFHDDVLQASSRGHTVDDTMNAIACIKNAGFNLIIQLMPGLPCDTPDKSIESAHIACTLQPNGVRIYPTIVIKDTVLEKLFIEGIYTPMTLEEAVTLTAGMYSIFTMNNIPVIRMGLHPFANDTSSFIVAGPYHPSFGYLVKSRYCRNQLQNMLQQATDNNSTSKRYIIELPALHSAEYLGAHRENIAFLQNMFYNSYIQCTITNTLEPILYSDSYYE